MFVTIIAVFLLCKPLTNFVYDNTSIDDFFSSKIENTIGEFLDSQLEKGTHINPEKTNISRPIAEKINTYIDEARDKSVPNVSEYIANQLAYIVISALVVIVLFISIRLATIVLKTVLAFISELPFINKIDKAGGIIYGLIRAFIIVYFVLAILSLLSPLLANTGIIAAINNSKLCEKLYNNNVFLKIFIK